MFCLRNQARQNIKLTISPFHHLTIRTFAARFLSPEGVAN